MTFLQIQRILKMLVGEFKLTKNISFSFSLDILINFLEHIKILFLQQQFSQFTYKPSFVCLTCLLVMFHKCNLHNVLISTNNSQEKSFHKANRRKSCLTTKD